MAAPYTYLQSVALGTTPNRDVQREPGSAEGIRLILGFRRFLLKLACPSHAWNWPRPIQGERAHGFDAHQTCFKCMTERFYNTQTLQAGPLYRSLVAGTPNSSRRGYALLLRLKQSKRIFSVIRSRKG